MRTSYLATGLVLAGLLAFAAPVSAEVVTLKADLKASNEVPPNSTTGSGTVTATYDTATKQLSYKGNYSGLSGPAIAGHFHGPAVPGTNTGVVVPFPDAKNPSFEGTATLTDAQATDMLAGRWYANIHTDANKGGEIRGQLLK
jgi:hypothetical protein